MYDVKMHRHIHVVDITFYLERNKAKSERNRIACGRRFLKTIVGFRRDNERIWNDKEARGDRHSDVIIRSSVGIQLSKGLEI